MDLNYANPRVFAAMLDVFLKLANAGVDGFRLDSVAYLWKEKGTACRNLPQAHDIVTALRHLLAIARPGPSCCRGHPGRARCRAVFWHRAGAGMRPGLQQYGDDGAVGGDG